MYRRRSQTPFRTLLSLILLGMLGGVAFLVYDGLRNAPASQSPTQDIIPTIQPTSESIAQSTPIPDQPLPTATSAPHTVSLVIPSLAINAPIIDVYLVDGIWDVSVLGSSVGHLQGTARVGEEGNTVLSGHVELRDGTKGVFGLLDQAAIGDRIILRDGEVQLQYVIVEVYVTTPEDLGPVYPTVSPRLTLITCGSYDFLSNQYLERTIVVAEPIG